MKYQTDFLTFERLCEDVRPFFCAVADFDEGVWGLRGDIIYRGNEPHHKLNLNKTYQALKIGRKDLLIRSLQIVPGETIIDAQIGYDFGEAGIESLKGLSIFFQAQNLTEEPFTSLQGENALQVRDYQDYGSTYLLGFSYKL